MVKVDTRSAEAELRHLASQLSSRQVADATKSALNDSIRKGRTEVKRSIMSIYNISGSRIDNPNRKKVLSVKMASSNNLSAEVDAGHIPINLSEANAKYKGDVVASSVKFNRKTGKATKGKAIKRSTGQISVEVVKGQRKVLESAFTIGTATHKATGQQFATSAIFSRGSKGKPAFQFGKARMPIDSMSTVSVAAAAINTKAQDKVQPVVNAHVKTRLEHHFKRKLKLSP